MPLLKNGDGGYSAAKVFLVVFGSILFAAWLLAGALMLSGAIQWSEWQGWFEWGRSLAFVTILPYVGKKLGEGIAAIGKPKPAGSE